jgi:hypothetical protein
MLADNAFGLLKADPRHPSLQLKKVGRFEWGFATELRARMLRTGFYGSGSAAMLNMIASPRILKSERPNSLPLNGARRFMRQVVKHCGDSADLKQLSR